MLRFIIIFFLVLNGFSSFAFAEKNKKFALLIGNKNYKIPDLNLKNPHNDIERIGVTLRKLGFRVTIIKDATFGTLQKAVKRHTSDLRKAGANGIGFFYYSGHGAMDQNTRINYLIPVDIVNTNTEELWDNSIRLQEIIDEMKERAPQAIHFVVFDACRNELNLSSPGSRSLFQSKGFRPESVVPGMLIAYSTAAGDVASDEGNGIGPYAEALSEELLKPSVEITTMFRSVQLRVRRKIKQEPWLSYNALPEIYLAGSKGKKSEVAALAPQSGNPCNQVEKAIWEKVKNNGKKSDYQFYLRMFPEGCYSILAKYEVQKNTASIDSQLTPSQSKEVAKRLQAELKRVGCYIGAVDGLWGIGSKTALTQYNKSSGLKYATDQPSEKAIQDIGKQKGLVCKNIQKEKVASTSPASGAGSFNGIWKITRRSPSCYNKSKISKHKIQNGNIGPGSGYVKSNGKFFLKFGSSERYGIHTGWIKGNSGSGNFTGHSARGTCTGSYTMQKVSR
ncbi:MAG: caspase family protein [Methyloligellaceae bacterium]